MLKVNRLSRKTHIQEEATLWLSKIESGLNSTDKQQLVAWLNQDKDHFLTLSDISNKHPILTQLSGLFPLESKNPNGIRSKGIFSMTFVFLFCLISALTINILSLLDLELFQPTNSYKKEYVTDIGQKKKVELTDGSIITLNTNSAVKIDFSADYRRLTLTHGEAQFSVAKDSTRPFTVFVGENSFTALGTIFNIQRKTSNKSELVVTEGTVFVAQSDKFRKNTEEVIDALTTHQLPQMVSGTILTAGHKSDVVINSPVIVNKVELDQIQKDLAWQQDMLIFNGEPLQDVLADVERYHSYNFEITEQQLKHLKVAGYFKTGDIKPLLTSLNYNFDISHKIVDNTIFLSSKSSIR